MLIAALLLMQVPNYDELPARRRGTEIECAQAIARVEAFVNRYHGFVTRHEIDSGGRLTTDEGAIYRAEADRYMDRPLTELRELRFSGENHRELCHRIAEDAVRGMVEDVLVRRWGVFYNYRLDENGQWRSFPRSPRRASPSAR